MYRIVHFMGYGTYLEEHGMDGSRADILEAIGADQPTPLALLERLEELEQVVRAGARGGEEAQFLLSTIHSSKGLEYGRVILMDVADGIFPKTVPEGPEPEQAERDAYEEERRLFYVGMTRAEERTFHCTLPKGGTVLLVCGGALSYATGVASQSDKAATADGDGSGP